MGWQEPSSSLPSGTRRSWSLGNARQNMLEYRDHGPGQCADPGLNLLSCELRVSHVNPETPFLHVTGESDDSLLCSNGTRYGGSPANDSHSVLPHIHLLGASP